jgi:hypothetical protein
VASIVKGGNNMLKMYEEYKAMRQMGATVETAVEWAKMMRACDYNPFE